MFWNFELQENSGKFLEMLWTEKLLKSTWKFQENNVHFLEMFWNEKFLKRIGKYLEK